MKRLFKPAALLFYLLVILVFFFIGAFYAGISDAAKDQGLAGGAIVLWYALNFSFFSLIAAFFFVYHSTINTIVKANRILAFVLLSLLLLFIYLFFEKKNAV